MFWVSLYGSTDSMVWGESGGRVKGWVDEFGVLTSDGTGVEKRTRLWACKMPHRSSGWLTVTNRDVLDDGGWAGSGAGRARRNPAGFLPEHLGKGSFLEELRHLDIESHIKMGEWRTMKEWNGTGSNEMRPARSKPWPYAYSDSNFPSLYKVREWCYSQWITCTVSVMLVESRIDTLDSNLTATDLESITWKAWLIPQPHRVTLSTSWSACLK